MTTISLLYVSAPLDGGHRVCCDGLQYLRLYSLGSRLCCNSTSGRVWKYEIGCKTRVFSIKRFDTTQVPELHCHAEKTKAKRPTSSEEWNNHVIYLCHINIFVHVYIFTYYFEYNKCFQKRNVVDVKYWSRWVSWWIKNRWFTVCANQRGSK